MDGARSLTACEIIEEMYIASVFSGVKSDGGKDERDRENFDPG